MRWLRIAFMALLMPALAHGQASIAQSEKPPLHVTFVLSDSVRSYLADAWDDSTATQNERGYCLGGKATVHGPDIHFILSSITPADSVANATPYTIDYFCPAFTVDLHIHTPATCTITEMGTVDLSTCVLGGVDAWECYPSRADLSTAQGSHGLPLSLIQCDKHAVIGYSVYKHLPDSLPDSTYPHPKEGTHGDFTP